MGRRGLSHRESALFDELSERELALLSELLRIEDELIRFRGMRTEGERVMYELMLDQLDLMIRRLSPEDDPLWRHVARIVDRLRDDALARSERRDYSFEALIAEAEIRKGAPLSSEEVESFRELADEIAEVDRLLADDLGDW